MKKPLILIIFFITVITGLVVVQVAVSNKISTAGIELENLQAQTFKIKKENTILEDKVLEASSIINLSNKAKELGFVSVKSNIYISNPLPLALKQ